MTTAARIVLTALVGLATAFYPTSASAAERTYTYTVSARGGPAGDLHYFSAVAYDSLNDARGWSLGGSLAFEQVASGGDFDLILATPAVVDAAAPGCSARWSCRVGRNVYINDDRWRLGTDAWPHSLRSYQQYVINHEVGHWLGVPHTDCPTPGRTAWVMQQQSISLQGCAANVWPVIAEREQVARSYGVPVYWTLIELHYQSLRNRGIPFGLPVTWERYAADGVGRYQHFSGLEGASIFWSPHTGVHEVYGPIRDKWEQWGWEQGLLGFPTSDQYPTRDGQYSHFEGLEGASIFSSPRTGTHEVYGPIRDKWEEWGWAEGLLGFPTSDQLPTQDGVGQYSHFEGLEGASIFSTNSTGAHEVYGPIRDEWAERGWEQSSLGYPVTGVQAVDGGSRVDFQGGYITLDDETGRTEVVLD